MNKTKGCGEEIEVMDWNNECYKYVICGEEDYLCSECIEKAGEKLK
jgi:hypothetical protein